MAMSERVTRLRQQSLDAIPTISAERAELIGERGAGGAELAAGRTVDGAEAAPVADAVDEMGSLVGRTKHDDVA